MRAMLGTMTIRLVMITHAPTAATREARFPADEPLDARGAETAAGARGALRRFDRVLRGPERRCGETAAGMGLDAIVDPSLADLDLGSWHGRTLTELEASAPADLGTWLTDPDAAPHGGESLFSLMDRVAGWLGGLPEERVRIAAVTHPAVVRAAALQTLGAPLSCFWRLDSAPLTQTWLTHSGGRWQLRETGHPLTQDTAPPAAQAKGPGQGRDPRPGP
jgi:broad specificity phosphatase PhoE